MSTLAIQVDELVFEKFKSASPQEQLRLEELFNLWWKVVLDYSLSLRSSFLCCYCCNGD